MVAVCGLVYELLIGTLSSYLIGDSVFAFSLVIGLFMTSMGLGSWGSRFVRQGLAAAFVQVQTWVGLVGGLAPLALFYAFAQLETYYPFLVLVTVLIGTLIGFEIPLVLRLAERLRELRINVANVLTADYIGALAASLLFPLVLVPQLGLLRVGLFFGLLNLGVAAFAAWVFREELSRHRQLIFGLAVAMGLLVTLYLGSGLLTRLIEDRLYEDEIIYAESTPYQRIVVTRDGARIRLFLDGALQLDSLDEYRYHESLVHPALALSERRDRVLVLGGGDGMAAREILRWPDVSRVDLVDLDPAVTRLFADNSLLQRLNDGALDDPRVTIHNVDAWQFVKKSADLYDTIVVDLPDPRTLALSRLYTRAFYRDLVSRLARGGVLVTQATSPLYARKAFWCIAETLESLRLGETLPYHAYVPSFGEWGFVMASRKRLDWDAIDLPGGLRFLSPIILAAMPAFPADMTRPPVEINRLADHVLLRYYEEGWSRWFE